jgi:hypothetical protein
MYLYILDEVKCVLPLMEDAMKQLKIKELKSLYGGGGITGLPGTVVVINAGQDGSGAEVKDFSWANRFPPPYADGLLMAVDNSPNITSYQTIIT